MYTLRLIRKDGSDTILTVNKTVERWLWNNYYDLGYCEVHNLTNMGIA